MLRGPPLLKSGPRNPPLDSLAICLDNPKSLPLVNRWFPEEAGVEKLGRFSRLKNSARYWTENFSLTLVFFRRPKSSCWKPRERRMLRPAFPYEPGAGTANAFRLAMWKGGNSEETYSGWSGTRLGRWMLAANCSPWPAVSCPRTGVKGAPVCELKIPWMDHPSRNFITA